mmetsp:Transcript_15538/g.34803  ORF Transcript_15538/g.34803 Transcript_15538/m.34803 type:complete len:211 (+) Transcript_15538:422-1054(+)
MAGAGIPHCAYMEAAAAAAAAASKPGASPAMDLQFWSNGSRPWPMSAAGLPMKLPYGSPGIPTLDEVRNLDLLPGDGHEALDALGCLTVIVALSGKFAAGTDAAAAAEVNSIAGTSSIGDPAGEPPEGGVHAPGMPKPESVRSLPLGAPLPSMIVSSHSTDCYLLTTAAEVTLINALGTRRQRRTVPHPSSRVLYRMHMALLCYLSSNTA